MEIKINLTGILNEDELDLFQANCAELVRCRKRLLELVPNGESLSQVELENLLVTDRPEIKGEVATLIQTISDERREVTEIMAIIHKELTQLVVGALTGESVESVQLDESNLEWRLGQIIYD